MAIEIAVALRMGNDNGAASVEDLTNHVIVIALKIESELHQQVPSGQAHVAATGNPTRGTGIRGPDFLAQVQLWKAVPALTGADHLFECPALGIQLPLQRGVGRKVRN
jgi:hypothetical protein